jgi:hypothetical protein
MLPLLQPTPSAPPPSPQPPPLSPTTPKYAIPFPVTSSTLLLFRSSHCLLHLQTEKEHWFFLSDPTIYQKEFLYITQSYNLTWHDVYVLFSSIYPRE